MRTKPIVIVIQCVTLGFIFYMMATSGVSKYNVAGAVVMLIAIGLNLIVEYLRWKENKNRKK